MASSSGQGTGNDLTFFLSQIAREADVDSNDQILESRNSKICLYLEAAVPIFGQLLDLREEGQNNSAGNEYYEKRRQNAGNFSERQLQMFFKMLKNIAHEVHTATGVFKISESDDGSSQRILDMCMAPGGFLQFAMEKNPRATARAFSLPRESGGHEVRFLPDPNAATVELLDVTMLAADMGVEIIPPSHPEANMFLPKKLLAHDTFDLAICDGHIPRTHSPEAYKKEIERERVRLMYTQLALALEHVKPGGSMLVLMRKIEAWDSILVLRRFSMFSNVRLYKPACAHAKTSSYYMVATNIESRHKEAINSVLMWKRFWKAATFDTEAQFTHLFESLSPYVDEVLEDFGPTLACLGKESWQIQANALVDWLNDISGYRN